jgi:hypothetical protein
MPPHRFTLNLYTLNLYTLNQLTLNRRNPEFARIRNCGADSLTNHLELFEPIDFHNPGYRSANFDFDRRRNERADWPGIRRQDIDKLLTGFACFPDYSEASVEVFVLHPHQ